jgi:hypothetical protein
MSPLFRSAVLLTGIVFFAWPLVPGGIQRLRSSTGAARTSAVSGSKSPRRLSAPVIPTRLLPQHHMPRRAVLRSARPVRVGSPPDQRDGSAKGGPRLPSPLRTRRRRRLPSRWHKPAVGEPDTAVAGAICAFRRSWSFGTCVKVELVSSGRTVEVRLNDRGPFVKDRIIDLSEEAAKQLGLTDEGVGKLRLSSCG